MSYQQELNLALDELETNRELSHAKQIALLDPLLALGTKLDYVRLWKLLHCRETFEYYFERLGDRHGTDVLAYLFSHESPDAIKWFTQKYKMDVCKRSRANIPFIFYVFERDMDVVAEVCEHFRDELFRLRMSVLDYVVETGLFITQKKLVRFLIYEHHAVPSENISYKLANKIMENNLRFEQYLTLFIPLSTPIA